MEYITSRGFVIPKSIEKFEDDLRFHLWQRKFWPYEELVVGDTLYWYETPSQSIVWKSEVVDVERFQYGSKQEVRRRLVKRFHDFDQAQGYFVDAPERGYCLALQVKAIKRVDIPKPKGLRFPQLGWLRVDSENGVDWLSQVTKSDEVILDDIVPNGNLLERIQQINASMAEVLPTRVAAIVEQTIRKDTKLVKALKTLCEFRCQFPGCGVKIPRRGGGFYIEVAHIAPVSKGGRSLLGNLLVLCPNHHKEFDYGDLKIIEQTEVTIRGILNGKEFDIQFPAA